MWERKKKNLHKEIHILLCFLIYLWLSWVQLVSTSTTELLMLVSIYAIQLKVKYTSLGIMNYTTK